MVQVMSSADASLRRRNTGSLLVLAAVFALAGFQLLRGPDDSLAGQEAFANVAKVPRMRKKRYRVKVVLLKDDPRLGLKGDVVDVRGGFYRNHLYPDGVVERMDSRIIQKIEEEKESKRRAKQELLNDAMQKKMKIEDSGMFVFKKKAREGSNRIYGSLTAIAVAEEVAKATGIAVRPVSVSLPKVDQAGEYTATIEITEDIYANIKVKVVPEGGGGGDSEDS
eukprot:TRINITY_DN89199_c0_g1_i1.p1 TRINITY_DN89199_c0_g1~~TRINITY_DN89199_c0_g1_i1.p1  ORF type:complete len:223 (-),score=50.82 TRINITY_DN89199_c0_g1_i1:222-890(-)